MPRLSDSMEEGTILRWLVADGDTVQRGQELAEIETDKASMVYEADAEGTIQLVAREGDTLPVGAPIAQLLADGEAPAAQAAIAADVPDEAAVDRLAAPEPTRFRGDPARAAAEAPSAAAADAPATPSAQGTPPPSPVPAAGAEPHGRVKASPLARRLAAEASIDVASLAGSGPGGRVVKADVERARAGSPNGVAAAANGAAATSSAAAAAAAPPAAATGAAPTSAPPAPGSQPQPESVGVKGAAELVQLTRTQELIARRMAEAKATIPEFTLSCEIEMDAAVALRGELKALAQRRGVSAPSYNDLVVRACALALRQHPKANGSYRDGRFELHQRVNVGVAVATEGALVVPVVRDADTRSVWEIASEARRLAGAVRDGSITPPELSGGTFSVSNLGMFGVDSFTAVINPPQAAILAVGSLKQRALARDGQLALAHTMHVTLSCDHRILYGADAAQFLAAIRELLEQPLALLA